MKTKMEDFDVSIPNLEGNEVERKLTIKVRLVWDADFGEWVLSEEAHKLIEDTKAREMRLLIPSQLKELRERLGYTQKQMGELFQIGEKSWSRWESGKHRPSRLVNLLIRMLYDKAVSIEYLWKLAGKVTPAQPAYVTSSWRRVLVVEPQEISWPAVAFSHWDDAKVSIMHHEDSDSGLSPWFEINMRSDEESDSYIPPSPRSSGFGSPLQFLPAELVS